MDLGGEETESWRNRGGRKGGRGGRGGRYGGRGGRGSRQGGRGGRQGGRGGRYGGRGGRGGRQGGRGGNQGGQGTGGGGAAGGGAVSGSGFQQGGLVAHNKFRQIHGTPAMKLSKQMCQEAEAYAKVLAQKGSLEHAKVKDGENLAYGCSSGPDAGLSGAEATKRW